MLVVSIRGVCVLTQPTGGIQLAKSAEHRSGNRRDGPQPGDSHQIAGGSIHQNPSPDFCQFGGGARFSATSGGIERPTRPWRRLYHPFDTDFTAQ